MAYGKVDRRVWNDERFRTWSNDTKLVWLYLLSSPHANRIGCFVLDPRYAAADLDMDPVEVEGTLEFFDDAGRIVWDPEARVVCIRKHLHPDYNPLANPSVAKAAASDLRELPQSMKCFHALLEAVEKWSRPHYQPFTEALMHRVEQGDAHRGAHQEQEQEHEQEQGTEGSSLRSSPSGDDADSETSPEDVEAEREAEWDDYRDELAGAIKSDLYERGQPPPIKVKGRRWSTGRDLSICKQFVMGGYDGEKVLAAVRGYALMVNRRHDAVSFATEARRTLLPLREKDQQGVLLIEEAASYWHKHGEMAGAA